MHHHQASMDGDGASNQKIDSFTQYWEIQILKGIKIASEVQNSGNFAEFD